MAMSLDSGSKLFLIFSMCYMMIRLYYMAQNLKANKAVNKADSLDNIVLFIFGFSQLGFPILYLFSDALAFANYPSIPQMFVPGAIMMAIGLWLFWRSHADLGLSWSVTLELNDKHHLVTNGVYRFIRHPMYCAFFLLAFGQACLLPNWIAGCSSIISFAALYALRLPREEAMMTQCFGEQYQRYMQVTGRIIPKL